MQCPKILASLSPLYVEQVLKRCSFKIFGRFFCLQAKLKPSCFSSAYWMRCLVTNNWNFSYEKKNQEIELLWQRCTTDIIKTMKVYWIIDNFYPVLWISPLLIANSTISFTVKLLLCSYISMITLFIQSQTSDSSSRFMQGSCENSFNIFHTFLAV